MPSTDPAPSRPADVLVCDEVSVAHVDGVTECLDPACELPHGLHRVQATCADLDPGCACSRRLAA